MPSYAKRASKSSTTIRITDQSRQELKALAATMRISQAAVMEIAIRNLYQQEEQTVKQIKVGETNDLHLYAVNAGGRYYPLSDADLNFERPDAKIFYDSGIYPGVTDLPQYICDKATPNRRNRP